MATALVDRSRFSSASATQKTCPLFFRFLSRDLLIKSYDLAQLLRRFGVAVVSGFQSR
jgi:hypothetical protein